MLIYTEAGWKPFRPPVTPFATPAIRKSAREYLDMMNTRATVHNQVMALSQRFGRNLDYVPKDVVPYEPWMVAK